MTEPTLTERDDLASGRAGWEGATKGTKDRVRIKMGKISDKTHWVAGSPWGATMSKKGDGR